jgi:hypothetical protein
LAVGTPAYGECRLRLRSLHLPAPAANSRAGLRLSSHWAQNFAL